ncbi:restriction endonuclease [Streptomyces sp. NPDC092296]|uniref:restriction endonuclease n=1 Tax=Streptomyces sp. NPDC092296 TaxID=3366012 RepID=UPI00380B9CBF
MSRRSSGLIATFAEIQRQQRRQQEAQHRARVQQQREQERQQRAAERAAARSQREQQAAHRQGCEAAAARRTEELAARLAELRGLLAAGCRAPAFGTAALTRPEQVEPFAPGPLATPVPMPDPAAYQPPPQSGWGFGARRQAEEQARARYEQDCRAAQAAEAERRRRLDAYWQQYQRWAEQQLAAVREQNAGVEGLVAAVRRGDPESVVAYFSAALYASRSWPEGFPQQPTAAYDPAARQLVLDWELPGDEVVPEIASVRYMPTADREKETRLTRTERRTLYREVLAQCLLLVLHELFAADGFGVLESVALNGFVPGADPVTGLPKEVFLATVTVARGDFERLHLAQVSPVDCLVEGLRGQLSQGADRRVEVRPGRTPAQVGRAVPSYADEVEPDLYEMDPIEFEELIAELFRARGMRAVTTQRSGDGGVDVDALDPDPISGGRIVVQAKRYRRTVPPTAVRDLFGTVQDKGANKGLLVTTSSFGPTSYEFAAGKPLTLVTGPELVDLLHRHGLGGRLGDGPAAPAAPAAAASAPADDANVLGMSWSGSVALDVCALVCTGTRVVAEEHFVFYNNPATPDGSVRMLPPTGPDRAALRVAFDRLPAAADRLVLVAAIDPEADPAADLAGFTDARIRLADAAGTEIEQLAVSDGRPGETALVLGSFRRRAGDDWAFVLGGKGYPGGLAALVEEYGIEVA